MSQIRRLKPFIFMVLLWAIPCASLQASNQTLDNLLQKLDSQHFLLRSNSSTKSELEVYLGTIHLYSLAVQAQFYLHYQEALVHTEQLEDSIAARARLLEISERVAVPGSYFRYSKMLLGLAYLNLSQSADAKAVLNSTIAESVDADDFQVAFHSFLTLGDVYSGEKNFPLAFANYKEAQSIMLKELLPREDEAQSFFLQAEMNYRIGYVYRHMWRDKESIDYFKLALKFDRLVGNSRNIKYDLNQIADAYIRLGDFKQSEKYLRMLEAQFKEGGYRHEGRLMDFSSSMILHYVKIGEASKANKYIDIARSIEKNVQGVPVKIRYYLAYAEYLNAQGLYEQAIEQCKLAESIATELPRGEYRIRLLKLSAVANFQLGFHKESAELFEKVYQSYLERSDHIRLMTAEVERARFDFESEALKIEKLTQDNHMTELALESEKDKLRISVLVISLSLLAICSLVAMVLYASRNEKKLRFLADYDSLTGVLNRRAIIERGERVANTSSSLSLLLIDVDHFKSINDSFGHARGDRVLQYIALVASGFCDGKISFGRLGGEEFLFVIRAMSASDVSRIAEDFSALLKSKPIDGVPAPTVSIGFVHQCEARGDFKVLLEKADEALYQAKSRGRDCVVRYRPPTAGQESSVLLRAWRS
ncbi:diguanylate cyclase [Pseudoteredinibacter isoporae]|uniref:diguanylate cyclase n=1 Tax=Pseudoteredinibacter isoporae TaxID=570281 RepID=UPI00310A5F27